MTYAYTTKQTRDSGLAHKNGTHIKTQQRPELMREPAQNVSSIRSTAVASVVFTHVCL